MKIENEDDEDFSENSANKICQWTCIENEETSARTIIFNNVILNSAEQLSSIGNFVLFYIIFLSHSKPFRQNLLFLALWSFMYVN